MTTGKRSRVLIACGKCGAPVPVGRYIARETILCSACNTKLRVDVFPAFFRRPGPAEAGESLISDGDASCFYHGQKKAAAICAECGRFLCSLCEVRIGGSTICPECVEKGRTDGSMERLVTHRTLYDGIALSVSILPMLFVFITPITAPIAIFIAIRQWKKPCSILPRTRVRHVLAIAFALFQIAGWGVFLAYAI